MKTLPRFGAALLLLGCFALLGTQTAEASHYRGGYITYTPTGTPALTPQDRDAVETLHNQLAARLTNAPPPAHEAADLGGQAPADGLSGGHGGPAS